MRKFLLTLHLFGGLISAATLLLLGLSGGLLVFENEINHLLNPSLYRVQAAGAPLSLNELSARLEQLHPGCKTTLISLPQEDSIAYGFRLRSPGRSSPLGVTVNPYSGAELGMLSSANEFTSKLHQFHTNLLLGPPGKTITAASAMFLLGLSISGLVLWWPRKIWRASAGSHGGRLNFEVHNFLGLYASAFMLIFGLTGLIIHWDGEVRAAIDRWQGAADLSLPQKPRPVPNGKHLSADELAGLARAAVPGAAIATIQGLNGNEAVRITMKYPEDGTPAGRTIVQLAPVTGEVLALQSSRTGSLGMRVAKLWNRELHTGDIAGWPTKLLASAASFSLPLLAISGPLIWLGRIRRKRRTEGARVPEGE